MKTKTERIKELIPLVEQKDAKILYSSYNIVAKVDSFVLDADPIAAGIMIAAQIRDNAKKFADRLLAAIYFFAAGRRKKPSLLFLFCCNFWAFIFFSTTNAA